MSEINTIIHSLIRKYPVVYHEVGALLLFEEQKIWQREYNIVPHRVDTHHGFYREAGKVLDRYYHKIYYDRYGKK